MKCLWNVHKRSCKLEFNELILFNLYIELISDQQIPSQLLTIEHFQMPEEYYKKLVLNNKKKLTRF